MMTKLTDTQLVLLSAASRRQDRIIPISERLMGGVATAVGEKLIMLGFAEERTAQPLMNGWRQNVDGKRLDLVITVEGLAALGIDEVASFCDPADAPVCDTSATPVKAETPTAGSVTNHRPPLPAAGAGYSGTKKAQVISLLQQESGASIDDLVAVTGWLPHTTRAALTGLRKAGMTIEMSRKAGFATCYRIVGHQNGFET
jgi:Protein of unknown function (DUF3489)